jgi:putative ABC transport system permease protein
VNLRFALLHAWREARAGGRGMVLHLTAVALGVAALVAINSFRANVVTAVEGEARTLMGADVRFGSARPFTEPVDALLDSLAAAGAGIAREVRLASMALAPATGAVRLVQLRAIWGDYPFYGEARTEPAGLWPVAEADAALVDPALLVQLSVSVGDELLVGARRFRVAGTIERLTGDVGIQTAVGPRVVIRGEALAGTGLIGPGSLVRHEAYVALPGGAGAAALVRERRELLREQDATARTAAGQAQDMTLAFGIMGRFLGLVGLVALLLGGLGVASAVNGFIRERLSAVAVLRCLGARRPTVFLAYLLQTAGLGLAGAAAGAVLGLAVQQLLPRLFAGLLPVEVAVTPHFPSLAAGLVAGAGVALAFALLPLLDVRRVAPLQALRREVEPLPGGPDWLRVAAWALLAATVAVAAVVQAPTVLIGLAFAAAIAVALVALAGVARVLVAVARRTVGRIGPYPFRQGIASLFRPHNQTLAVTLALGFGVFLLASLFLVQHSLLDRLRVDAAEGNPNLLLFDVHPDQAEGVAGLFAGRGAALRDVTPVVPARIAAVRGVGVAELLADTGRSGPRWALRREYRNTYREAPTETETVVAGRWWTRARGAGEPPRVSLEEDLARELGVGVGDAITWDIQGVEIESRIVNLRRVDWARFAPNFFVVFEPGVLEAAPHSLIALARVPDATQRAELQRDLVLAWPNVAVLDLTVVQEAVETVVGRVTLGIRFLALFSVGAGLLVLAGAVAASRRQRRREAALLRTLGAGRRQLRLLAVTEYLALGGVAGLAGGLLALLAGWAVVTRVFELPFAPAPAAVLGLAAGTAVLAAGVGVLAGRDILRRPPLETLRESAE